MIKVGIIGCGKIAQVRHIPEYIENPNVEVVGYYDINLARAQQLSLNNGGIAYSTYEELLSNEEIDAVSVCVANNAHAEITIAAFKAGKHVLCEKPMATTLAECEDMVEAAKKSGKYLMIGHNQRLTKAHRRAKELIESGFIGDIVTFKTTFGHGGPETWSIDSGKDVWFFDKNKASMGAMADLGIHKTDLIQYLTGQTVIETTAKISTLDKRDSYGKLISVDDNTFCIYKMSGGSVGTMTASWTYYGAEDNSTVLYGTKGIMRIYDDSTYSIKVVLKDGEEILFKEDAIQTNDNQTKSGIIDLFVDCLIKNIPPEISGEEALKAMRAIFGSIQSSETGKSVIVNK